MPEPANSPPPDVPGRHLVDTGRAAAGGGKEPAPASAPAEIILPTGDTAPAEAPEPEPPISLKPPNARPTPPPLEVNSVRIVAVGTVLWFAGFAVLLPMRGRLAAAGNEVWLWTCLAGGLLGLLGLLLAARARAAAGRRAHPRRS